MEIIGNIPIPTSDNRYVIVDGFLVKDKKPKPIVILSHGFKGFKDWGHFNFIAQLFAEKGFIFLKFNFSHNGTSFRKPTEFVDLEAFGNNNFTKELDDLGKVIDWASSGEYIDKEEMDLDRLYLIGHSRGGAISILKASEDDRVKKLVTWAALNDFMNIWKNGKFEEWKNDGVVMIENKRTEQQMPVYYQLYEDFENNKERLNIEEGVKKINIPYLIVHGTADESVPVEQAKTIHGWNSNTKLMEIDGANHTFGSSHPPGATELTEHTRIVVDATMEFFRS
ncbi:MAG: alpha/beta fold hydrolase [Bacteroidia bacterium]|nr:alpha/beta fold hydrolase [Bacteroidia bacterium]